MDKIPARVIAAYGVIFSIVLYVILSNNVTCLLYGLDGTTWLVRFAAQAARDSFSQLGTDPLQGNFDAFYSVPREYFLPEALALLSNGTDAGKVMTYAVYGILMVLATYALARSVGLARGVSFFSGSLLAAISLPTNFHSPSWIYGIYNLFPHLAQITCATIGIIACFWAIEVRRPVLTLAVASIAVAAVVLSIASFVTMTVLMLPTIAVYAGASILASQTWSNRLAKIVVAATCVVVPLALGMAQYAIAVGGYTAYHFFGQEFMQSRASLIYASILYNPDLLGKVLVIGGFLGAAIAAFTRSGKIRIFAQTHVLATILFQVVAVLVVVFANDYHGPSPLYFEFMVWPIMMVFTAHAISIFPRFAAQAFLAVREGTAEHLQSLSSPTLQFTNRIPRHALLAALPVFLLSWDLSFGGRNPAICESAPFFPIKPNAITEPLAQAVATGVDAPFRGLAATFDGAHGKAWVDWFDLHANDAELWRATGNDLRLVGLWWYNIPTLTQYSPLITPPYYLLLTDFLSRPADRQVRSVLVLTQPNERMLELWGVRFIIADYDLGFGEPKARISVPGRQDLALVELGDPNLGNYSPTTVHLADNFREGLRLMHDGSFDGRHAVVTDSPLQGSLVAAENARLVYRKSGFTVSASSAGHSMLVLPIQYSRCWSVYGQGNPVLLRANLMQLGVSFTGRLEANLIFRFGPFLASECRLEDIKDMERLGIRQARAH